MYTLTIDFEAHDPYLKEYGPGWAYGLVEILCLGYKIDNKPTEVTSDVNKIRELVSNAHTIVAHNSQYDLGVLSLIVKDLFESNKIFIDTIILAKLHNNVLMSYSLDDLAKKYLNIRKDNKALEDLVVKHSLATRSISTYAKTNIKQLYSLDKEVVEKYCRIDVDICYELYTKLVRGVDKELITIFSDLQKVVLKSRKKGINVDVERLKRLQESLIVKINEFDFELQELYTTHCLEILKSLADSKFNHISDKLDKSIASGEPKEEITRLRKLKTSSKASVRKLEKAKFNANSAHDVASLLEIVDKIKLPRTVKGNFETSTEVLEKFDTECCKLILEYRLHRKLCSDFCDKIIEMQEIFPEGYKNKVYPVLKILGAETGRFSCSTPNFQQVPNAKKHKEIGKEIRSCYTASKGKLFAALDYSSQEPRLQVHYASLLNLTDADMFVEEFRKNRNLDLHQLVATLANIEKVQAKTINLGVAYGMGVTKLAKSLKLTDTQAKLLLEKYHSSMGYLKELDAAAKEALKNNGCIKTLMGRKLKLNPETKDEETGKTKSYEYRALNKLIQGSSADQTMLAMIALDKAGINVLISVHDEICIEVDTIEEAKKARDIMENVVKLRVPAVSKLEIGNSWGEGSAEG